MLQLKSVIPIFQYSNIPLSLKELSNYLAHLDELILIRRIYDHSCVRSERPILAENKRPTLDSPSF
jgi:hypothetical protein